MKLPFHRPTSTQARAKTKASPGPSFNPHYQSIFDRALKSYEKKTGKALTSIPLFRKFETCSSPGDAIALLREQLFSGFDRPGSGDSEKLTNWLNLTVNTVNAFSGTIGASVSLVFPPAGVIFTGIGVLLSTATALRGRRDKLIRVLGRIESVLMRLEICIELPRTSGMTEAIVKVLAEVLYVLAVATREIKENLAKAFVKKLAGRLDLEDALRSLDAVIEEEMRIAAAQMMRDIYDIKKSLLSKPLYTSKLW